VQRGLVDRKADPQDRRHVALRLSRAGRRLVREVMRHREQLLERIVAAMPSPDQVALMTAIESFNTAAQVVGEELLGDPLSGRPAVRWLG
jgi:DNA-binding MarR family transcriptional regulator